VVTHNVSVMVIQAGAARKVMDSSPDQAREALLAVEAGGRAAMAELRHVMDCSPCRAGARTRPATRTWTPQPGLDRLGGDWCSAECAPAQPIELTVTGHPMPLPPGIELTLYRLVQEARRTRCKHAAGASATGAVEYGADHLQSRSADTGGRPGASAAPVTDGG
jgi:signal transduction histidine kinase